MNRAIASTAAALVAAVALSACTPEVPPVPPVPPLEQTGAMADDQAALVIEETFAELAAADEALDADLLGDRVGGDAKTVREAQYLVAGAEDGPQPAELPEQMQAVFVTNSETWPRVMVAVTEEPEGDLTPVVMLWVQDSIFTDYQLRAWAHMVPGAQLPSMAVPDNGSMQLALGEASVEPSPRSALDTYLELLRQGPDSDLSATFAPDGYRDRLFAAREALSEAAGEADGDYLDTIQPNMANTYALSTADGGALVFAPVEIASSFSVEDAKVSVPATDKPLVDGTLEDKVTHHYLDFVVLFVPGPGASNTLPAVVAADHHLVRVSDS